MLTVKPRSFQTNANRGAILTVCGGVRATSGTSELQMESQMSLHQSQMSEVKSALSDLRSELLEKQQAHKAKIGTLEEALAQAHTHTERAQRERDFSLQQAKEKDAQICQITGELHQIVQEMKHQLSEKDTEQSPAMSPRPSHELEQLSLGRQQLKSLVWSLREQCQKYQDAQDQSREEVQRLQALLGQQGAELQVRQQEVRRCHTQLEKEQVRVQALQSDVQVLQLNLENVQKSAELQRGVLETLQEEKTGLDQQLVGFRLDNQLLQAALKESELRLSAVEKEKTELQTTLTHTNHSLHQLTLEKQQVTAELGLQHVKLVQLQEEKEALSEQHNRRIEELKAQNCKLQSLFNKTQKKLQQALRALDEADGHGLKVAQGMQQELTAKREQIDLLQSRVQMLEEITEKFAQEKGYQAMETKSQEQDLLFERENRSRLESELENLRTSEKRLKCKVRRLDMALHKMSDSFSECQEFIQKQEQDIAQLKLQHALEVKELQGQNLRSTAKSYRPAVTSPTLPVQPPLHRTKSTNPTKINVGSQRPDPLRQLSSLNKELHGVTVEEEDEPSLHTNLRTRWRCMETHMAGNEQGSLQTTHLHKGDVSVALFADNEGQSFWTPSLYTAAMGRKSPVHSLLTSDLCTDVHRLEQDIPLCNGQTFASKQCESAGPACKELQGKLENLQSLVENLQMKNQEMSSMMKQQERRIRRIQTRREPQKT